MIQQHSNNKRYLNDRFTKLLKPARLADGFSKPVLILFLIFNNSFLFSQNVFFSINQDTIQIGDPVELKLQISSSSEVEEINWDIDSIPSLIKRQTAQGEEIFTADFEILNGGNWNLPEMKDFNLPKSDLKWTNENGNLSNVLTFTIWNEGIYFLPPMQLIFNQNGRKITKRTNQLPIVVGSPLTEQVNPQDSVALGDIKPIIAEPIKFEDYLPFVGIGILLLHLICIIYFLLTNKKKEEILPIPVLEIYTHELANDKLSLIENAKLWQQGNIKEYLSKLTFVIREYLENRFNIPALESTTTQILDKIKIAKLSENQRNKLKEMLQVSDLVKFAKAEPQPDFLENTLSETNQFIQKTKDNMQMIWVERAKYHQLKSSPENALSVVGENIRVTQNLEELTNPKRLIYANFWERFAARLLDLLFLVIILTLFVWGYKQVNDFGEVSIWNADFMIPTSIFFFISTWFYRAFTESKYGGTPGKLLLDLRVTDMEGEKISFPKSSLRWFGKTFSELLFFIGNFWFYFNKDKRQTLYDSISKTIVIKK